MRHRGYPITHHPTHPHVSVVPAFRDRPMPGGALVMFPLPVGVNGQPWNGMDPSAPATWVRPWNPQPGMIAQLNFDGAKQQWDTPMGGTWRNVQHDRKDVKRRRFGRRRR